MTMRKQAKQDIFLGLVVATWVVLSIWLIISTNKTLDDAQMQMRTMPRDFLVDVINTQNHVSLFQQLLNQYMKSPSEEGLRLVLKKQVRLDSRANLLLSSLVRLGLSASSAKEFTEELGYLKSYIRDLGILLNGPVSDLVAGSAQIDDLMMTIEDSMTFLFTEANALLHRQANHQNNVLSDMSTTLTILFVIGMVMFVGLTLTLRKL